MNSMQERETLETRLAQLIDALGALPRGAVTVYEDAGFHVQEFSQIVRDTLAPHLDVFSLNEDELMGALGRSVDLLDPQDLTTAVRELAQRVRVPIIMLHTRHFALAHGARASWMSAVLASGIAASGARFAYGDNVTRDIAEQLQAGGPRSREGQGLAESLSGDGEFYVVPAFDFQDVATPTTIGLGDSFVGGAIAAIVRAQGGSQTESPLRVASN